MYYYCPCRWTLLLPSYSYATMIQHHSSTLGRRRHYLLLYFISVMHNNGIIPSGCDESLTTNYITMVQQKDLGYELLLV